MPTMAVCARDPLCTTSASSIDRTQNEHGFTPSTNPISTVAATSDESPTSTVPKNGTSTDVRSSTGGARSAASATTVCSI